MSRWQRAIKTRWVWLTAAGLVGCAGYAVQMNLWYITSTTATLQAMGTCSASSSTNPCTFWFQYWKDGAASATSTAHTAANYNVTGTYFPITAAVSNLSPDTVYHYQFCGYGDTNLSAPGLCTGPFEAGGLTSVNAPGTLPDATNFSGTTTFRTAGNGTAATADIGRVVTTADTPGTPISRDSGYSVQYASNPTKVLWLFDDTKVNYSDFLSSSFGTAARGSSSPGLAPQALVELPTPPTAPPATPPTTVAQFLPTPAALVQVDGLACGTDHTYSAQWNMGAAKEPGSSNVLIVYGETCVCYKETGCPEPAFLLERVALAEYDPIANKFLRVDHPFVASPLNAGVPKIQRINSPIFPGDGYVYFYVATCPDNFCQAGSKIYVARVKSSAAYWSNAANYKWWLGGTSWGASSGAVSVISNPTPVGASVHVADYSGASQSRKYVMIEQTTFGVAQFNTYYATSPTGPWTLARTAKVPEAECKGPPLDTCYALKGHPELSDQNQLVFSWYSPDDRNKYGHIRLGAVSW